MRRIGVVPTTRVLSLACIAAAALAALAPAAGASPTAACTPVPVMGLLCTFDAQGDGIPERVYVYDPNGLNLVLFDAWQRPGYDALTAGSGTPVPGYRTGLERVSVATYDSNADHHPELTTLRIDALGPSNMGGYATLTLYDRNSNGGVEAVDLFVWNTQDGARYQHVATGLS